MHANQLDNKPIETIAKYGSLSIHKAAVIITMYPDFGVNLKYKRYIIIITQRAINANSADIEYKCTSINNDKRRIVPPLGMNAQTTAATNANNGLPSFELSPILTLKIINATRATKNLTTGTK